MRFSNTIFSTESGKTLISALFLSFFLFSCGGGSETGGSSSPYKKVFENTTMKSFSKGVEDYSINAEYAYQQDSSENLFMKVVRFVKNTDSSFVTINSDSCISSDEKLVFLGAVKIENEDSMKIFTEKIVYMIKSDTVFSEDSLLILKNNDRMKTKGFISDGSFKRVLFSNPVIITDN